MELSSHCEQVKTEQSSSCESYLLPLLHKVSQGTGISTGGQKALKTYILKFLMGAGLNQQRARKGGFLVFYCSATERFSMHFKIYFISLCCFAYKGWFNSR